MLNIDALKECWDRDLELETVERIAHRILEQDPHPVVRFRLLRDVLRVAPDSDALVHARREMLKSRWVQELKNGQKEDESWGKVSFGDEGQGQDWDYRSCG